MAQQEPQGCWLLPESVLFYNHAQLRAQNSKWIPHRDKNHTCGEWESGSCVAEIYRIFDAILGKEQGLCFSSLTSPPVQTLKLLRNSKIRDFFFSNHSNQSQGAEECIYIHLLYCRPGSPYLPVDRCNNMKLMINMKALLGFYG